MDGRTDDEVRLLWGQKALRRNEIFENLKKIKQFEKNFFYLEFNLCVGKEKKPTIVC